MESRKQTTPDPRRPRHPPAEHRKPENFSNCLYSTQWTRRVERTADTCASAPKPAHSTAYPQRTRSAVRIRCRSTIRAQYGQTPRAARMPLDSRRRCLRRERNDVTATVNHHTRRTTEWWKHGQNDQSPNLPQRLPRWPWRRRQYRSNLNGYALIFLTRVIFFNAC